MEIHEKLCLLFLLGLKLEGHITFHPVKWEWYSFFSQCLWSICTQGGSSGLKLRQFNMQCHWPCAQCCIQTNNCTTPAAYITHSCARESSWDSPHVFGQGEWHSSLDCTAHSQGSFLSPPEQETWFSLAWLPGCIHPCPPWPPSTPSHTQIWKSCQLYQASHMWLLWGSHQGISYPGDALQCTSEILAGHSCTILPLPYQLHFSGSSSRLWHGFFSVPVIFFVV